MGDARLLAPEKSISWGHAQPRGGLAAAVALAAALAGALIFMALPGTARAAGREPKAAQAPSGNVTRGKKLFTSYGCYECHGRAAQDGTGPRLGPDPIPFSALLSYVRHPAGNMPPFTTKVASDQDLADIFAFLSSLPEPPKLKDIPLLRERTAKQ